MANTIDPITGLQTIKDPKKPNLKTDPITGESFIPVRPVTPTARPQLLTTQYTDNISKYQKYNVPLRQEFNWDEQRAQRQSTTEKWGHGLLKAGVTTVGAVSDNTLGVLAGIGQAAVAWDATKFYDNEVGKAVDKTNNWMQENFPNYYTEAEREASALESLGYANFWADKVANGLGYAVGSIGTVYLTGGVGLATRGMQVASKGLKSYRAAKAVSSGVKAEEVLRRGAMAARAKSAVQTAEIGMMMSYGESSVEAREVLNRTTEKLTQERASELGIPVSDLSESDLREIKETAAHAANVAFSLNMAVLSATNLVTFGKMLLPKYTQLRPSVKGMTRNAKSGKIVDRWAESPVWKTTAERYLKSPLLAGASETFQEGTQFAIQEAADTISDSGKGSIEDWTEAMAEGYGQTFNTKEGQESMMLGFIIGGMMGGVGSFKQRLNRTEENKDRKKIVDALNSDNFTGAIDGAKKSKMAEEASKKMQVALEAGDHKGYRDAQFELIMSQVAFHESRGSLDFFIEKLDDAATLPDAEFREAFGIPDSAPIDKVKAVEGIKSKIEQYQKVKEQLDSQFPPRTKQGIDRLFMSKEAKKAEEESIEDERIYKSILLKYGLNLEDSNGRISNLIQELNELNSQAGAVDEKDQLTEEDFNLLTKLKEREEGVEDPTKATMQKLEAIVKKVGETNPLFKELVESKAADIVKLSQDRDFARSALSELYADPATRQTALNREKAAELKKEQDAIDNSIREEINTKPTSDHILDLLAQNADTLSPEIVGELSKEYNRRLSEEAKMDNELYYKKLEDVEEMLKTEKDAFKINVLKKHIEERRKTGEVNAREKKESSKAEDRKEKRAERKEKREKEKEARKQEQKEDSEGVDSHSADTITVSEEKSSSGQTVITVSGEFDINEERKIIVDEDGNPTVGNDKNQTSSIDRNAGKQEGLEGKEISLRLLPESENYPQSVGIFLGDSLLGVVSEKTAETIRPRLLAGETITGTITERFFNNITNLRTASGEKVFLPANESLQGLEGFVGYAVYNGEAYIFPDDSPNSAEVKEASSALNTGSRAEYANLTAGQVVLVVKTPEGRFKAAAVSTSEVGEDLVNGILDNLSEGTQEGAIEVRELMGITAIEEKPDVLTIGADGTIFLPYNGEIVKISPEELVELRAVEKTTAGSELDSQEREERVALYKALRDAIATAKLQVNVSLLGGTNSYVSPKTSTTYSSYREYVETELIKTDFKVINGSIFFDVGIKVELGKSTAEEVIETYSFEEENPNVAESNPEETTSQGTEASGKFGDALLRLGEEAEDTVNLEKAKAWLINRFGKDLGIVIFENLQKVGDATVHGYMENGAIHLYRNAEIGTEYHEGFHLFFRGLLTDEQRQSLYEDAAAIFGEPTADDIKNARRGKNELSNEEARLLALEEKMAEEFREYSLSEEAPKSLGQKIAKFFKDLLAYIKAIATDRVGVRQAFRLLEGNKIPKSFTRSAAAFSPGRSYMLKEYTQTPKLHKEKVDLIIYNTLALLETGNFTIEELLGNPENEESLLRDWFLRHAISKEDGSTVSAEEFEEFKSVYDSSENSAPVVEIMKNLGIRVSPPLINSAGIPLPQKTAGNRKNGLRFIAIYDKWFDSVSDLGGIPIKGFRSEVTDRLKTEYGYKVVDSVVVDTETEFERIFGITRLEEEPAKKLSAKAKRTLSRIPVQDLSGSFFGFQTYIPITDIFNELAGTVVDSSSLVEMLAKLKQNKNSVNSLNAVYDFIEGLDAQEQALLYSTLSLGMNAHRTLIITETEDGASSMLFSPVKSTVKKYFTNKWRNAAVGGKGVYKTIVDDNGNFKGLTVDKAVATEIAEKAKIVLEGMENPGNKELEAFSDALWLMGITLGSTKAQARIRVKEVFSLDGTYKQNLEEFIKGTQLQSIMTEMFSPDKKTYTNVFETESTTMGAIASTILSKFETPKAASFLSGSGNMMYALNLKSDLTITKELIQSGEYGEIFIEALGHQTARKSSLGSTLLNNDTYQELFEPVDLDIFKILGENTEEISDYSKMTYKEALAVSLNMAFPSSGTIRYIALDTPGDRNRLTFIPVPKWEQRATKSVFGLNAAVTQGSEIRSILENYILLDLHRIGKETTMDKELMTYHSKERFRALQVGGELDSSMDTMAIQAMHYMDNVNLPMPEDVRKFVDDKVEEVLQNIESYYADIVDKVGGEGALKNLVTNRVDARSYVKGKELDLVKKFVEYDMVGRLVSREIFRAGINHTKDGADYNKRSALITTPGTMLMLAGDSSKDSEYGMSTTFNEITASDIITSLPTKTLKALYKKLVKQVGKKEAKNIIDAYKASNSTDAQAFISPSMYRNIRMGMGLWTSEDQAMYENYKDTGKWEGAIMPLKPSYEFRVKHEGRVVPISHKNSYIVLTKELAESNKNLTTLLNRMEAVEEFEGLTPIDVVNMESAKKTGGFIPIDATNVTSLKEAKVMVLDSRGLKFPQIIPEKDKSEITFGRQPRKTMIANIVREGTYTIDGTSITGEQMFQLYQSAIVEKLTKNKNKIFKELGYDKVLKATTADERYKALQELLPSLQKAMVRLGVEKDYPQNILDSLELVKDENGDLSTALPLPFPSIQAKLEQLIFGMFRREIYQQKMQGMEMVQFSEFGGTEQVDDLKFYTVEGGEVIAMEVDIRYDVLERMGIDPTSSKVEIDEKLMTLIGYRIPQQGKSSTVILKVRNILPPSHKAAVRVPGAITTMMGSDFDVDKLYILFPEARKRQNKNGQTSKVEKVPVDYSKLKKTMSAKGQSMQQLNNIIFDTLVAVGGSVTHLSESIAPLDIKDVEAARNAIGKAKEDIDINNPSTRLQTGIDNMLSGILRGLYANGIAGRNVATASKIDFVGLQVSIDGQILDRIVEKSPFGDKRFTDYYISQYLSAALDSVKDPIQAAINDNALTAPITIYLLSIGATPKQVVAFLNVPAVKAQIETALETEKDIQTQLRDVDTEPGTIPLTTEDMLGAISGENPKYDKAGYIRTLKIFAQEARKVDSLYRVLSPDAIDKAGTIPQHLLKIESKAAAEDRQSTYGGVEALVKVTEGTAYKSIKAFYDIIEESLSFASSLGFVANQEGVKQFKKAIKTLSGRQVLSEAMHRDINRAIVHHLVTKPGSPIFESNLLLETTVINNHMEGGLEALLDTMKEIVQGESNLVLEALKLEATETPKGEFVKYVLDTDKVTTTHQKNYFTATLKGMMDNPAMYGEENAETVNKFIEAIVSNSIVTSGFAPSPDATFSLIPVEYFKALGVTSHLNNEIKLLNSDSALSVEFINTFLTNYGHNRFGGEYLFKKPYRGRLLDTIILPMRNDRFIVANKKNKKTGVITSALYQVTSEARGTYVRVQTKGQQRLLYEAHLKRENGEPVSAGSSLINKNVSEGIEISSAKKSKLSLEERETSTGSAEKIARLKASFSAAGIDVTVVEAELPPGEKGQVIGDLIILDPNQMDADTVYHEFGHILVDMLPEAEVDEYIEQIRRINPDLVQLVEGRYPELSGRELGKEILVTAIGLEGAKIERKAPSKLQRLVNKILRAIGKLFGVKPNAAAVLAEKMFAKEIRAEYLTGELNPKVQRSKKLQDNISKTFEEVSISLKRQLMRLENLPESEKTTARIREIKTLQKNLTSLTENAQDINQFINFQKFVVGRVDKLEVLMDNLYDLKDTKLSRQEALQALRTIGEIKETIDSLYNTDKSKSTVFKMKKLLRNIPFGGNTEIEVAELRYDLEDSLDRLDDLEQDYQELILPLVADTLLTYGDTSINDEIDAEIKRVRKEKDISSFRKYSFLNKIPEYLALKKRRKEMTPEEYIDAMVEVKVNNLKSKRIGRDQIIAELRDAHSNKRSFSYYLDPMVYSNEANLSLFALSIKDAINNANESSRGFLYELEKQYSKFKEWKGGDFKEAKFNEDLLTTVTFTKADGTTIELLSLVQEYDVDDFYKKRDSEIARLTVKYKKPENFSDINSWRKSREGKMYAKDLASWYKKNTEKAPGGVAENTLKAMEQKELQIRNKINALPQDKVDVRNILLTELSDLKNKINSSYSKKDKVFMGDLAVPNESYKSAKYKKIVNTPELKEYYDFIVNSFHASQKKVGKSELFINSWDKYSYIMPSVRKDRVALLQDEGWMELAKETGKDFRRLETDTEFGVMTNADGGSVQSIPRFYTNQVSHREVSKDIASSIAQFTHMANTFQEKSNVVGLVETMMTLHENRKTLAVDPVSGLPLIDEIANRVTKENKSYVLKPGVENNSYKHLKEFVDSVFYGQFDLDQGSVFGVNISKIASKATAFTAVANLAFNTLQVGNQFVLDNLMSIEEAVAGQFYSKSDFAWAAATYAAEKGALGDLGKFVPKSKLGQAMQMFDALNEISDSLGEKLTGNVLKKSMQSDPLFALQHAVEHQSTATRMLALMHSTAVKDENGKAILNEEGKEANLWDMLIMDKGGKLIIDPRVKNVDKNKFIAKLHGINKRTNQVKGSFDKSMGSRRALGKLLLLFRNYFIPGLRKRFGHGEPYHVDHELGEITKGMYISVFTYVGNIMEGKGISNSLHLMNETDKKNLKRVMFEALAALTTAVIFSTLNTMIDMDDDDEDSYALVYAAYQARRLQTELLQFVSPGEFFHLVSTPMATVNWLGKYIDIIDQITLKEPGYALGLVEEDKIFYQRKTGTAEKGDRKVFNKIKKVVPVLNGWQTSFLSDTGTDSTKEKIRWFIQ